MLKSMKKIIINEQGLVSLARQCPSPNFNQRPDAMPIDLLVIHNISLPPANFSGTWIDDFFTNQLDTSADPYFKTIAHLKVSSHLLIRRDGELVQYVPLTQRAWHAGVSEFEGRDACNDFSIGIELEGTDDLAFTDEQYTSLVAITHAILKTFPQISSKRIAGHSDIAPGRKTDPGGCFDWVRFLGAIDD